MAIVFTPKQERSAELKGLIRSDSNLGPVYRSMNSTRRRFKLLGNDENVARQCVPPWPCCGSERESTIFAVERENNSRRTQHAVDRPPLLRVAFASRVRHFRLIRSAKVNVSKTT